MKILIVTNFLPPKIGGIERLTHELAYELHKSGLNQVTVACAKWPERFIETRWTPIDIPYQVIHFPSAIFLKRLPFPNVLSPNFWRAIKSLESQYEIVIFQSHLFVLNWLLALKYRKSLRRIWINHGCNFIPVKPKLIGLASKFYEQIGMQFLTQFSNEYLGQSKNASDWVSKETGRKFQTFSNSVNLEHFNSPNFVRKEKKTKVLFVGRFVEGKGVFECIQSVSEANKKLRVQGERQLFDLTIIGAGPLDSKLRDSEVDFEIDIKGELEHAMVISSMFTADILIQAYGQPEGLTTVTLEGLAAGMLIVTTPLSGDPRLVACPNYAQGELGDLPAILIGMRDRLESREELVRTGREFIENGFTWEVAVNKLLSGAN